MQDATANAPFVSICGVVAAGFAITLWKYLARPYRARLPLPPGPKPLPIIGNLLDFPKHHEWLTYNEWSKIYGAW